MHPFLQEKNVFFLELNFATNQNDVKLTDKNRSSILAVDLVILRSDRRFSRHFQILLRFRATDFRFIVR